VCCRTVDVITHARFQVNRFRGFRAPGGRKWPSPMELAHRPYNSVRTNVLHCDMRHVLYCLWTVLNLNPSLRVSKITGLL